LSFAPTSGRGIFRKRRLPYPATKRARDLIRALQIIVTVPVLLDRLLCHSRAWLPREESRPHVLQRNSGFLARARHARGNDRKFDRADVRVSSCAGFNSRLLKKAFSTAGALTLVSPEAGEKIRKEASFYAGC
jgi:hypothetical protein